MQWPSARSHPDPSSRPSLLWATPLEGSAEDSWLLFIAFAPSFCFIIAGAPHFDRLRADTRIQAFLTGAGAAVIGAIAGSAIPLGRELAHFWQLGILGLAAVWLLGLRRGVVSALLAAGVLGVIAVMASAPA